MKGDPNAVIEHLKQKRTEEDGFTLIELLIVIIVLGILAAIVVFAIGTTKSDSVAASCKTDAKAIELSLEAQNTRNGGYPASQAAAIDGTQGALLKSWPGGTNAATDNYVFTYGGGGAAYTVGVAGLHVTGGGSWSNADDTNIPALCAGK